VEGLNLLPEPLDIDIDMTRHFIIGGNTRIVLDKSCNFTDFEAAKLLQQEINQISGFSLSIIKITDMESAQLSNVKVIYLKIENDIENKDDNESYKIKINDKLLEITAVNNKGLFYGIQTLRQLIRSYGFRIPLLSIVDKPHLANRGFYHDVTRGKVPTLATLKELVDRISFYKINQLQLYVEHTFAFEKMTEIWIGTDPLTAEEIMELDQYCQKRHVELIPSLSTFGHLYQALSTTSYSHLAELDAGPDKPYSWIDRQRHHTLDVSNPESFKFVQAMLDQYIPLFSSDKFNICCDETFDLGEGKNKELAKEKGKGRLYLDFLKKIISYVKAYDKEVMFWGDIIIQHPELLDEIPEDVICLNWEYNAEPDESKVRTVHQSGIKQYLCPGVSGWNMLMNDMDNAFSNIEKMIEYGEKYGSIGILNTDWGDYGHINLLANSMPGMVYAAALSWNPERLYVEDKANTTGSEKYLDIDERISLLEFQDHERKIVGILRKVAQQQKVDWGMIVRWKESKYKQTTMKFNKGVFSRISEKDLMEGYDKVLLLADEIVELSMKIKDSYRLDFQEFYISAQGIALLNALALIIKRYDIGQEIDGLPILPVDLAVELEYWFNEYEKVWRARNKESELYRIGDTILQICSYLRGLNSIK